MSEDIVTFEKGRLTHVRLNAAGEIVGIDCIGDGCPLCASDKTGPVATVTAVNRKAGTITVGRR